MVRRSHEKVNAGGHLSCDFYTFYSEAVMLYDETQAARRSFFDKMNFDVITELVKREGIDCEYKDNGGGWNVYLTKDDFEMAKRDVEGMKAAGGYVSSLKIFEGQDGAEVFFNISQAANVRRRESNIALALFIPENEHP